MRLLLIALLIALGCGSADSASTPSDSHFVYIKLGEGIQPLRRARKYEDSLQESLVTSRLGEITGGGSQLGHERPDGTRLIEYSGIDVELTELDAGLELLRRELPRLGAPPGTELHYLENGDLLKDEFLDGSWSIRQPRTGSHPSFGF